MKSFLSKAVNPDIAPVVESEKSVSVSDKEAGIITQELYVNGDGKDTISSIAQL